MIDTTPIRVSTWFQGPTGSGQGGWTTHRLATAIGEPVTVAIRRPIPLNINLAVVEVDDSWHLVDPAQPSEPVLIATRSDATFAETNAVSVESAADARSRFPLHDDHPVPVCFSCGTNPDSMRVHSGPLGEGRWATDWTVPDWAVDDAGTVDEGALWAAIDCAQAWYAGNAGGRRHSVTVQLAVEIFEPLEPGATYSLVAWNGTYDTEWDGRKRGAGGAVFANNGTCVAHSSSFWIAI
jgi:hypothetical protein